MTELLLAAAKLCAQATKLRAQSTALRANLAAQRAELNALRADLAQERCRGAALCADSAKQRALRNERSTLAPTSDEEPLRGPSRARPRVGGNLPLLESRTVTPTNAPLLVTMASAASSNWPRPSRMFAPAETSLRSSSAIVTSASWGAAAPAVPACA